MENRRGKQMWVARLGGMAMLGLMAHSVWASEPFGPPKPDELAMKSVEGYPGAPAVVLYREEIDNSLDHSIQRYERVKILTEEGKKYANIELGYRSTSFFNDDYWLNIRLSDIAGRTIHADGTIVPFTGKPYEAEVEKVKGVKVKEKIFTLPDVQVGSIIEWRYTKYSDGFGAPDWYIQGELYVKSAHYKWLQNPYSPYSIATFPVLPLGAKLIVEPKHPIEVTVTDVQPLPTDDFLPPSASFVYRVQFNYTLAKTRDEFWKTNGEAWSKSENDFLKLDAKLSAVTQSATAGAKSEEEKLRKIYAFVEALENTDYARDRGGRESKASGQHDVKVVSDVLDNKRGNGVMLTDLFVAMARSAGMKAYLVAVPDRTNDLFSKFWLSFDQFKWLVAMVNVDGKDVFLDPGSGQCPYGVLSWQFTLMTGMRQTDAGIDFVVTPSPAYSKNHVTRVADLTMDAQGAIAGKVEISFEGAAAMQWRREALLGDEQSLQHDLEEMLKDIVPKTVEVKFTGVEHLADAEQPLTVSFEVHGPLAATAGKRLVMPADLFVSRERGTFANPKRELAVYFHYPELVTDTVKVKLPSGLNVEALPDDAKAAIPSHAQYIMTVIKDAQGFVVSRTFASGQVIVPTAKYDELRAFYQDFEGKDQESVVLKTL